MIFALPVVGDLPADMRMEKTLLCEKKCLGMSKELACRKTISCTNATSEEFRKVFRECKWQNKINTKIQMHM
jgi:hypothetical protein